MWRARHKDNGEWKRASPFRSAEPNLPAAEDPPQVAPLAGGVRLSPDAAALLRAVRTGPTIHG